MTLTSLPNPLPTIPFLHGCYSPSMWFSLWSLSLSPCLVFYNKSDWDLTAKWVRDCTWKRAERKQTGILHCKFSHFWTNLKWHAVVKHVWVMGSIFIANLLNWMFVCVNRVKSLFPVNACEIDPFRKAHTCFLLYFLYLNHIWTEVILLDSHVFIWWISHVSILPVMDTLWL